MESKDRDTLDFPGLKACRAQYFESRRVPVLLLVDHLIDTGVDYGLSTHPTRGEGDVHDLTLGIIIIEFEERVDLSLIHI